MSTSGVITGQMTARDMITQALTLIGVTRRGATINADDMAVGLLSLSWMLKSLQLMGANLFRDQTETISWTAGNLTQMLNPNVLDVINLRVLCGDGVTERPLTRWERGDYENLPVKSAGGTPTIFCFIKTVGQPTLALWPVPTIATTLNANVARVIEDVTDPSQNIDLPQEWNETAFYMLAERLLDSFGLAEQQPATAQRIAARAKTLLDNALDFDRPGSVFMSPWSSNYV